jgi:hypothetical protein
MAKTKALRVFLAPEKSQPEYALKNNAPYEEDYGIPMHCQRDMQLQPQSNKKM